MFREEVEELVGPYGDPDEPSQLAEALYQFGLVETVDHLMALVKLCVDFTDGAFPIQVFVQRQEPLTGVPPVVAAAVVGNVVSDIGQVVEEATEAFYCESCGEAKMGRMFGALVGEDNVELCYECFHGK